MSTKSKRSSNFELLRVFAMIMIVAFHITYHTVNPQLTDAASIALMKNGLFNQPVFYKKLMLITTIIPFGKIGDTVFLLMSGYFMINKSQIDLSKIAKKLLFPLIFVATILVISSFALHKIFPDTFISLISITNVNIQSWFIGYYFLVMIIAALFLNKFLDNITKEKYIAFLFALFAIISFGWIGILLNNLADSLRTLTAGVFVYSLGGFIRKYDPFKKVKTYILFVIWIVVYAIIYLSYYNTVQLAIENYEKSNSSGDFVQVLLTSFYDFSLVVIILGVSLFEIFRRIHIPSSRIINYLGSATFTIYLLHDNSFFYSVWNTQDWITVLYTNPYKFLLKLLLWTLAVFAIGVLVHTMFTCIEILCRKMRKIAIREDSNQPSPSD